MNFFESSPKQGKDNSESADKALVIDPQSAQTWYNKGVCLVNLGRDYEGLVCLDRAVEINPQCTEAWFN